MKNETKPSMMTVKQIAKIGLMPENALRQLLKEGKLPVVYIGKKAIINYAFRLGARIAIEVMSLDIE